MPTFHPLIYSVRDGAAIGQTVEATDANEAVRHVAAVVCDLTLPEVDRALARGEFEVIAVMIGDPKFRPQNLRGKTRKTMASWIPSKCPLSLVLPPIGGQGNKYPRRF